MKIASIAIWVFCCAINVLGAVDADCVAKVQSFLNGIEYLKADFMQTNPDNSVYLGTIWLKRGKNCNLRLDYEEKIKQRFVADSKYFTIYDLNDQSKTSYNINNTPMVFLLRPLVNLKKDVNIEKAEKQKDFIAITVSAKSGLSGQNLTLYFSIYDNGNIKALAQWVVSDAQGRKTFVQLLPESVSVNDKKHFKDIF